MARLDLALVHIYVLTEWMNTYSVARELFVSLVDRGPKLLLTATVMVSSVAMALSLNLDSAAAAAQGEKPQSKKSYGQPKLRTKKSAKEGKITGPLYYYSVTHEESTGWIYVIPFCKKLLNEEFQTMKKTCKTLTDKGQRCETAKSVELAEAGGPKKKSFALDYFVFTSERSCVQDRESYTSGDVVPFH